MRVKTEDRRTAILNCAMALFQEVGYERASMGEIAARLGGSKSTLYSYFPSKEALYAEAMLRGAREEAARVEAMLDPANTNITVVLQKFGTSYLQFVTSPDIVAKKRAIFGQADGTALGPLLYEGGPKQTMRKLAAYLTTQMAAGTLRQNDAEMAALHLQALLEAGITEPGLFGAPAHHSIAQAVPCAIAAFLAIYGPVI